MKDETKEVRTNLQEENGNVVKVVGTIVENFQSIRIVNDEKFFATKIATERKSKILDVIPTFISEDFYYSKQLENYVGKKVKVKGEYRSYNEIGENGKSHLKLFIFAEELEFVDSEEDDINEIYLCANVCRKPVYRITPLGKKQITEVLVAAERSDKKADYIPCIAWNNFASWASKLKTGNRVRLVGRIQSRKYLKKKSSGDVEEKTTYEVSAIKMCLEE